MDGNVKKILIVLLVAVVIVSSLAIMAALKRNNQKANAEQAIETSLNVKNPVSFLDKNNNGEPDFAEVSVNANEKDANNVVDSNHDGVPDSEETATKQLVSTPNVTNDKTTVSTEEAFTANSAGNTEQNGSAFKHRNMTDNRTIRNLFPG